MFASEELFDECVRMAGGVRVKEIVGASPSFDNADYLFKSDKVVGEHKSLQKDFLTNRATEENMHELYNNWFQEGKVGPAYGRVIIRTDQLPSDCAWELISLFKKPLRRRLAKANKQIALIKERLGYSEALGVLFLSNDGNFTLDPAMTAHLLHHSLNSDFSHIDHVILLSANLTIALPESLIAHFPFFSVRLTNRRMPPEEFLNRLGTCWNEVLRDATGKNLPALSGFQSVDPGQIDKMRFRQA